MKTRLAICLAFAVISLAVPSVSASAQVLLPPYEITTSVGSMGLKPISPPVRRGARYVLRAIDGRGIEHRVAADAMTGRVLAVRPVDYPTGLVYAVRPYAPGYSVTPRGYEPVPTPPANIPERSARAPSEPPPVIYAPGGNPPAAPRPPVASKPAASPKIAKPKLAAPVKEAAASSQSSAEADTTTGSTPPSTADSSAVEVPPVQAFD